MPRPAVHPRTLSVAGWGWRHDFPCTAAGPHMLVGFGLSVRCLSSVSARSRAPAAAAAGLSVQLSRRAFIGRGRVAV